jgi:hypothetical protein
MRRILSSKQTRPVSNVLTTNRPVPKPDELFRELKLVREAQEQAPLIEAIREAYRQLGRPVPKPDDLFKELKLLKDAARAKQLEDQLVDKERELA